MKNVLIISGHPDLDHSLANRTILEEMKKLIPSVTIRRLDQVNKNYNFNLEEEQKALTEADVIVLEFPMYWYSYPALLKKYIDDVLSHGFAYGSEGIKLRGKRLILSLTTGAPAEAYRDVQGMHPVESYFLCAEQMCGLCGMKYERPIYTCGCMYVPGVSDDAQKNKVIGLAKDHAKRLAEEIESF
jgi:glutathione-regulated potassium-efflux system ancillary protein KefF